MIIDDLKNELRKSIETNQQILQKMEGVSPKEVYAYHTGFIHAYERILTWIESRDYVQAEED